MLVLSRLWRRVKLAGLAILLSWCITLTACLPKQIVSVGNTVTISQTAASAAIQTSDIPSEPTAAKPLTEADNQTITIKLALPYADEAEKLSWQSCMASWSQVQPDIGLELQFYAREDQWAYFYDISDLDPEDKPWLAVCDQSLNAAFSKLQVFYPMDNLIRSTGLKAEIYQKLWLLLEHQSLTYGMPLDSYAYVLLTNQDLLSKYSQESPATPQELLALCAQLRREPAASFALAAAPGQALTEQLLLIMTAYGASLRDLNSQAALEGWQFLSTLRTDDYINLDCVNWNQGDLLSKLLNREVAMILADSSSLPRLEQATSSFSVMAVPVPQVVGTNRNLPLRADALVSLLDLSELSSSLSTQEYAAIQLLVAYLFDPASLALRQSRLGSLPVRIDVETELSQLKHPWKAFMDSFYQSAPLASYSLWENMSETLQDSVITTWTGAKTVNEIAMDTYTAIKTYLIES
ncbi:hypothetical protein HCH52_08500 [Oscillospiraceae bacterium HV4-5-C5C]|nr:hypothetical protein [Oscillospiraceae bacterium HV4-5-C5C]